MEDQRNAHPVIRTIYGFINIVELEIPVDNIRMIVKSIIAKEYHGIKKKVKML
ncbi:hypothetical protein FACS1894113_1970 [Alphaproteobacteria bacterium]|nr:hypothetical protein FACS1894113_1970 [Alphaproteobacteria bacterium]